MSFHPREICIWRDLCEIETGWDGGSEIEVAQEGEVLKLGLLIFPTFFHILLYFAPSGVLSLPLARGSVYRPSRESYLTFMFRFITLQHVPDDMAAVLSEDNLALKLKHRP